MVLIALCSSRSVRRPSTANASYSFRPELEKRTSPTEISSVRLSRLSASLRIAAAASPRSPFLSPLTVSDSGRAAIASSRCELRAFDKRRRHRLDIAHRGAHCLFVLADHALDASEHAAARPA